ncbi:hypothetical protein BGY98DRAFT_1007038 [Russula aff. rugulosa BPL654]|nr:hypothetical protein BGY98DRAFT_1007038 [Russula aff. rugulosa BPL654]
MAIIIFTILVPDSGNLTSLFRSGQFQLRTLCVYSAVGFPTETGRELTVTDLTWKRGPPKLFNSSTLADDWYSAVPGLCGSMSRRTGKTSKTSESALHDHRAVQQPYRRLVQFGPGPVRINVKED